MIDRKLPWLKWLLLAIGAALGWGGIHSGDLQALPFIAALAPPRVIGLTRLTIAYGTVVLGIASLLINVFSVTAVEDRRKLKVILWGTLLSIIPAVLIGIPYDLLREDPPFWLILPGGASFCHAAVVCLRGGQASRDGYSGAAATQCALPPGRAWLRDSHPDCVGRSNPVVRTGVCKALQRRNASRDSDRRDVRDAAHHKGATQVHRHVRTRLDRAFFRSAYDAQQILETLAATTLTVTDREGLAALLHRQIQEALHPMPLYIYLLSSEGVMRAYAGNPPEKAADLPDSAGEHTRLAGRSEPVEVNPAMLRGTPLENLGARLPGTDSRVKRRRVAGREGAWSPAVGGTVLRRATNVLLASSVASQAGIAMRSISLAEKMAERMEAERRGEQEMQIARQVQSRLLPQQAPHVDDLQCAGKVFKRARWAATTTIFSTSARSELGLVLADISGKGISGALLMANLQASLRGQYALAVEDPRLLFVR